MLLNLAHKNLVVYCIALDLFEECNRLTKSFPNDEKYCLVSQIKRAALSVMLNIAEGSSRFSPIERKRFYEIARGSLVEIDTAMVGANRLNYVSTSNLMKLCALLNSCFAMLSKLIKNLQSSTC